MSDLQSYKKADLFNVCKKLEIPTLSKDTKKVLTDKLESYINQHPEDGILTVQSILEDKEEERDDEETLAETKAGKEEDEEEQEEEEEEEVEVEDKEDKDYQEAAPIDLKEWIVDPVIEKVELCIARLYEFTDKVGITTLEINDELRENLSRSISLNYLQVFVEFLYFLYNYVPLVPIKVNASIHQVFRDHILFLSTSEIPVPDLTVFLESRINSTLATWILTSTLLPLLVSYYVNFSRRVLIYDDETDIITRIYRFDPFMFALTKVVIHYFLFKHAGTLATLSSHSGIFNALKNYFFIHLGIYGQFTNALGNFPLVIGIANILVAIYSQFEEY